MDARGLGFQVGISCKTPEINAQIYHHIRQMGKEDFGCILSEYVIVLALLLLCFSVGSGKVIRKK